MTTATISIMNTDLAAIPVKEGHTRFYHRSTRKPIGFNRWDEWWNDDKLTFHCHFHGVGSYRNYVVGSVPYGTKATQEWHG